MDDNFKPGSHGCHEALHMAGIITGMIYDFLADHPSILQNDEWSKLAQDAVTAVDKLYQAIASEHLKASENV